MAIRIEWKAEVDGVAVPELDIIVEAEHEGGDISPDTTARHLSEKLAALARWSLYDVLRRYINGRRG